MKKAELEERLITFGADILRLKPCLISCFESTHLYQQLFRSATAVPLNYGESRGGLSMRDFVHKLSICLKETRESHINLRIMKKAELCTDKRMINNLIDESNQLIAIFTKSIETTKERYPEQFR